MLFQGQPVDVLTYVGYSKSQCGYCGKKDTSHSFGIWAHSLTPETYQILIDRGWRRSGLYLYRPNLRQSCCKSYTIKLNAVNFRADKKHRQALHKFNRFISGDAAPRQQSKSEFVLQDVLTESDHQSCTENGHSFETTFTEPTYTKEKFELYKKYQIAIHHDEPTSLKQSSFKRFLCDTPIQTVPLCTTLPRDGESVPGHPTEYGSYHQLYRLDGQLIALAVLDILPRCVSSVYFIYDPDYAHLSLGRVSACREAALALTLKNYEHLMWQAMADVRATQAGQGQTCPPLRPAIDAWYYMGFYIPTCTKMAYKGEYSPSYLLDPASTSEKSRWYPLSSFQDTWRQWKESRKFAGESDPNDIEWLYSFIDPGLESAKTPLVVDENDLNDPETLWKSSMPGTCARNTSLPSNIMVLKAGELRYLDDTDDEQVREQIRAIGAVIGHDLLAKVIVTL